MDQSGKRQDLFLGLLLSAFVVLAGCGVSASFYIAKGKKALDDGRLDEADIDYQKAVQKAPNSGDAWYGLGLTELKQAKPGDALQALTRASDLLPGKDDVQGSLGDACIATYLSDPSRSSALYNRATGIADRLLKSNPNSYDGLRLKGYLAMIDRKYPDAIDLLKKADAVKPGQGDLTHALMESLISNKQGPEAEKLALSFLKEHKTDTSIYDLLYAYYMQNNRSTDGEQLLKTKITNQPDRLAFRIQLALHYLNAKEDRELASVLDGIMKEPKRFPDGRMQVGNFYSSAKRFDEALRILQDGINQNSAQKVSYQQRTAEILVATGRPDQASSVIAEILKSDPKNQDARALRATIDLDSNQPDRVNTALAELQQLLKEKPTDANLHYNLGRAQLAKGNTDVALAEFQEAIKQDRNMLQPRVLAANLEIEKQDYKQASQYAEEVYALTGGAPGARLLRIAALTGLGNFEQASGELNRLDKDFPTALEPKLQAAALSLAQKKYPESEAQYRALYAASPKDSRALQGLLEVYYAQSHFDAAIQFLTQEKRKADSPQINALLADAALRGHRLDMAVEQYSELAKSDPRSPLPQLRLGDAYLQQGNYDKAIEHLQTARALAPNDALANAMLALAFHEAGKTQEAEHYYHATVALQSGNPQVVNNLAYLMAENGGNLDEALRLAQNASKSQPSNVAFADTVGWIYVKKNLPDSAIQILSNAVQKNPSSPASHYHLGVALLRKGETSAARQQLQAALVNHPTKADEAEIKSLLGTVPGK